MCGIAGIFVTGRESQNARDLARTVEDMLGYIAHRGPDEAGRFADTRAALGAVRLQIIDLVGGQQPLSDASGRYWIAYNGEAFNYIEVAEELRSLGHVFASSSDTEVVLHAWMEWGPAALERLNGGYAFAIYDRRNSELFLARDRYGKRPLFYTEHGGRLYFGSEMKSLMAADGFGFAFSGSDLASIATVWTPVGEQTGFKDVKQLPAGSWMKWSVSGVEGPHEYWSYPVTSAPAFTDFNTAGEELRELLHDAVRIRLRSDVEVGTYLSGGLDSTIITALTRKENRQRTKAFGVRFEAAEFDESVHQDQAAAHLDVEAHFLTVSDTDILEALPDALWHAEFPQFRSAFVPLFLLSAAVRDAGIKVVLTGEGADEVFFGYDIFKEMLLRRDWPHLTPGQRNERLTTLYPYLKLFQPENARVLSRVFEQASDGAEQPLFSHLMRFENGRFVCRFLENAEGGTDAVQGLVDAHGIGGVEDRLRRAQWLEVNTLLEGYLLSSQGDRASFAHGVEARCPFLDHRLAEWAARLPTNFGLSSKYDEKHILKAVFGDLVMPSVLSRPKQPYRAPGAGAYAALSQRGAIPEALLPYLGETAIKDVGHLRQPLVGRLLNKLASASVDQISAREDQAFMFILSLSVLQKLFVEGRGRSRILPLNRLAVDTVIEGEA